jgi:hypothetical protein
MSTSGKRAFGQAPLVPAVIWAGTKGLATSPQIRPPARQPLVPVRYMCTPFSPGLCLKLGLKASAYIYGRTPLPSPLFFFLDGGVLVCASFVFYSYALEVFVEMCVRAMPLKFTEHNYDMRCPSHA